MYDPLPGSKAAQKKEGAPREGVAMPLPAAVDMERAALSALMQSPDFCGPLALRMLSPQDFSLEAHAMLFGVLTRRIEEGKAVELTLVAQEFYDRGLMEKVPDGFLTDCYTACPNPAHFAHYAGELRTKAKARRVVAAAWDAADAIMRTPTADLIEESTMRLVDSLLAATREDGTQKIVHLKEAIGDAMQELEEAFRNRGHVLGDICTGFTDIDRALIKGLHRKCNYVIAGDTGSGKTALAVCILLNMALGRGYYKEFYDYPNSSYTNRVTDWRAEVAAGNARPRHKKLTVLLVCLESSQTEMAMQMLLAEAGVDVHNIYGGFMDRETMPRIQQSCVSLMGTEFYVWDAPGISVEELGMEVKNFKLMHKDLSVVCVDHAGLLHARAIKDQGNETAISGYVSNSLLKIYQATDVVGISLWQLNRDAAAKGEKGKRPTRNDLRSSGKIEQDAHAIFMPYRPGHYDPNADPEEAFIVIAKARGCRINLNGVRCVWHGGTKRFLSCVKWTEDWHNELKDEDHALATSYYEKYSYGDFIPRDRLFSLKEEEKQVK